jgi:hypothetical protein
MLHPEIRRCLIIPISNLGSYNVKLNIRRTEWREGKLSSWTVKKWRYLGVLFCEGCYIRVSHRIFPIIFTARCLEIYKVNGETTDLRPIFVTAEGQIKLQTLHTLCTLRVLVVLIALDRKSQFWGQNSYFLNVKFWFPPLRPLVVSLSFFKETSVGYPNEKPGPVFLNLYPIAIQYHYLYSFLIIQSP